jgi:hypothetical protein
MLLLVTMTPPQRLTPPDTPQQPSHLRAPLLRDVAEPLEAGERLLKAKALNSSHGPQGAAADR